MEKIVVYKTMGFHTKHLPEIQLLKSEYKSLGHDEFVRLYEKWDAITGPTESVDFVTKQLNKKTKKNVLHRKSKI